MNLVAASIGDGSTWVALITAMGPLLTAVVVAFVTWKVAVWKTRESADLEIRKEIEIRNWEARKDGYSVVFGKLGDASRYAERLEDGYRGPLANPNAFHASDRCRELSEKLWAAWADCTAEFTRNHFLFSQRFTSTFRKIERALPNEYDALNDAPDDLAACQAKAFREGQAELSRIAVDEFGPSSGTGPGTKGGVRGAREPREESRG